jgi:predicted nuclease with TOPRIM domain
MHKFSLSTPVEEMDEADLRSTLDEFMQKHEENIESYEALETERDQFSEEIESLEGDIEAFSETQDALVGKFSEVVAAEAPLFTAEEVADRFSLEELIAKADSLGAFSLEAAEEAEEDAGEGDEAEEGSTFADKPDRAPTASGNESAFRRDAESAVKSIIGDF